MDAKELAPEDYLAQFLGKTLRVYTNDDRMFSGTMRCTDKESNIILSLTHEYRQPSESAIKKAIAESGDPTAKGPMASRFIGLIVVPGHHITKIEYEESVFARSIILP